MNESITYKCPGCGAALIFDPNTQQLSCPYCFTSYNVGECRSMAGAPDAAANAQDAPGNSGGIEGAEGADAGRAERAGGSGAGGAEGTEGDSAGGYEPQGAADEQNMKAYHCTSCGAELVSDEYTSAAICGFCGNPTLVSDRLRGRFSPSLIIPFKIDKQSAADAFAKWAGKGLLTPKDFRSSSTIEKLSGIYVPFWFYDVKSSNRMQGTGLRVRREDHSDHYYVITDYYDVSRHVEADFVRIPADASAKMPDRDMDMLEPFDYGQLCRFEMPYLSGYLSERYNYTAEDMRERIFSRTNQYITDVTNETLKNYSSITGRHDEPHSDMTGNAYALLPVWMLNYHYKNADYTFYMNGQTGKIVAMRPISSARTAAAFILTFAASLILTMIGGLILW